MTPTKKDLFLFLSSLNQPRHLDYPNHLDQFHAHLPSIKFIIFLSYFNGKHLQILQQHAGNHLVLDKEMTFAFWEVKEGFKRTVESLMPR